MTDPAADAVARVIDWLLTGEDVLSFQVRLSETEWHTLTLADLLAAHLAREAPAIRRAALEEALAACRRVLGIALAGPEWRDACRTCIDRIEALAAAAQEPGDAG